jgi:hypothetical protein
MRSKAAQRIFGISAALLLGGCASAPEKPAAEKPAAQNPPKNDAQFYAGWYMESAEQRTFQACGHAQRWRLTPAADLPAKATAFRLQQKTPVYVQLIGSAQGGTLNVSRVKQFGLPTPLRNCAIEGAS